jgi:UDP-glucose:(heptosyl)LPS alpha-1,3-glucosyltransferase
VLVSAVCGYAHYIAEAESGLVLDEPFDQAQLNKYLATMLADDAARTKWSHNGLAFADTADLYSMPQHAADVILAEHYP